VSRDERPLGAVPRSIWLALAATLALQLGSRGAVTGAGGGEAELPPAPHPQTLRLAGLGESAAMARLAMLHLQSIDLSGGLANPYQRFDYERLVQWLRAILATDPRSGYPLFSAARIYSENPDPAKTRRMLEFIFESFQEDPNERWPWLAHAALLAKHRLHDLALARRYAAAVDRLTTANDVPMWARQMEIFILEDMNELEAAKIMLGGLIESGKVTDSGELRFLKERLDQLETRLKSQPGPRSNSSTQ